MCFFHELSTAQLSPAQCADEKLDWQELEGRRAFRVAKPIDIGGLSNPEKWDQVQNAQIDAMQRLSTAMKPYIDHLKV